MLVNCKSKQDIVYEDISHAQQYEYLPAEFHDIWLGIPFERFKGIRPNAKPDLNAKKDDGKIIYKEVPNQEGILGVTYYFDKKEASPLYEIIVEYFSTTQLNQVCKQHLKEPNVNDAEDDEWLYSSGEDFMMHFWTHQNKLFIVGKIPGTEWGPDITE